MRILAFTIAAAGVMDPSLAWHARQAPEVDVLLPPASDADHARAVAARDALETTLGRRVNLQPVGEPSAVVAIDSAVVAADPGVPVFALDVTERPAVRIVRVEVPAVTAFGLRTDVGATLHAHSLRGRTTAIELQLQGVTIASASHRWTAEDERFDVRFSPVAPQAGLHRLRVIARTEGASDAVADFALVVRERALRVLAFDPRPSWTSTFVRRALEADSLFEVAAFARTSRNVSVTAGDAPGRLTADRLFAFDAVLVGAPDAVTDMEWQALLRFASVRGGRVVLLPDRALPAATRDRLDLGTLEEVLVDRPLPVRAGELSISASEFLLPANTTGLQVIATLTQGGRERPGIVAVPYGDGAVVLVGMLDAWRFRGDSAGAGEAFWRALVADAAAAAPTAVSVAVAPALARPGDEVSVTVQVRGTEFEHGEGMLRVPAVQAAVVAENGDRQMLRLWPAGRPGVFDGRLTAEHPGRFTVTAVAGATSADALLSIAEDVVHPAGQPVALNAFAAAATSGSQEDDPAGIAARLSTLEAEFVETRIHPMRSPWMAVAFAMLLTAEWIARRRAGLR